MPLPLTISCSSESRLVFGRPYYRSSLWYTVSSVCLLLSVTFCIVAKWYILAKKCLKEWIGNQGQKVIFWVAATFLLPVSPLRSPRWPFFALCIVAKWYVLAKNCLKEWIGNQGQRVDFFGSPPYFFFWFRLYGCHRDGRFCLIFAHIAQQSVPDGANGLSSSKPCVYCRIVRLELKPDSGLFVFIVLCESLRPKCCSVFDYCGPRDHSAWAWPAMGTGCWALAVHSSQFIDWGIV